MFLCLCFSSSIILVILLFILFLHLKIHKKSSILISSLYSEFDNYPGDLNRFLYLLNTQKNKLSIDEEYIKFIMSFVNKDNNDGIKSIYYAYCLYNGINIDEPIIKNNEKLLNEILLSIEGSNIINKR